MNWQVPGSIVLSSIYAKIICNSLLYCRGRQHMYNMVKASDIPSKLLVVNPARNKRHVQGEGWDMDSIISYRNRIADFVNASAQEKKYKRFVFM